MLFPLLVGAPVDTGSGVPVRRSRDEVGANSERGEKSGIQKRKRVKTKEPEAEGVYSLESRRC